MRLRLVHVFSVLLLALAHTAQAGTVTIDFEDLRSADALIHFVGPTYESQGFLFTSFPNAGSDDFWFNTAGSLSSSFYGSTSLENGIGQGGTRLTRSDGGLFSLLSIDLAEMPSFKSSGEPIDQGSFKLTFYGTKADLSVVEATATIDAFPTVTTFAFSKFTDVTSVTWFQGVGGNQAAGPGHQFDNVRVKETPEPATILLIGTGLLTRFFRRKPSNQSDNI